MKISKNSGKAERFLSETTPSLPVFPAMAAEQGKGGRLIWFKRCEPGHGPTIKKLEAIADEPIDFHAEV